MSKWPGFDLHAELIADVERRFWSNVQKGPNCWEWTGGGKDGYGRLRIGGRMRNANVVSWTLHFGPVPPMGLICHHCDNPPCVRPQHLFLGDHSLNGLDASLKVKAQVTPRNEGDLLARLEMLRGEAEVRKEARRLQREIDKLEREAAREQRRGQLAREVTSLGLIAPPPGELAERRQMAADGLRVAVPMHFSDDEIRQIRSVPGGPGVIKALSRHYGISRQGIHAIRSRTTYAHVSDTTVRPDSAPDLTRKEESAS